MSATAVKVGVILGSTVISIVVVPAHCPGSGVNVYVVVPEELVVAVAEFHDPVIAGASSEEVGRVATGPFSHKLAICVKVGVVGGVTVTVIC